MKTADRTANARATGASTPLTEISDDEFALFQALICRQAGIHLALTKKPMLVGRSASRRLINAVSSLAV